MFCKICFDSCSDDFNTHNVKDSSGNVTCPILSNNKCYKCGLTGHTVKYCKNNPIVNLKKKVCFDKGYVAPIIHKKLTNDNSFTILSPEFDSNFDSEFHLDLDFGTAIWGIGLESMVGKSWADACGC